MALVGVLPACAGDQPPPAGQQATEASRPKQAPRNTPAKAEHAPARPRRLQELDVGPDCRAAIQALPPLERRLAEENLRLVREEFGREPATCLIGTGRAREP